MRHHKERSQHKKREEDEIWVLGAVLTPGTQVAMSVMLSGLVRSSMSVLVVAERETRRIMDRGLMTLDGRCCSHQRLWQERVEDMADVRRLS